MQGGDNIVEHINKFHSLINQLAGIKAKVDDDDAKAILLNSMPSIYDNIIFTLNKVNVTLEGIISTLIDNKSKKILIEEENAMFIKRNKFMDPSIILLSLLHQEIKKSFAIIVNN